MQALGHYSEIQSVWNLSQVSHLYRTSIILHMVGRVVVIRRRKWGNLHMQRSPKRTPEGFSACKPWGNRSRHKSTCQHPLQLAFWREGIVHSSGLFWSCHGNKSLLYLKFKVTPSLVLYVESGSGSPQSSGWWPRTAQRSPPHTSSQGRAPKALAPGWLDQSDLQQSASIGLYIKDKCV